VALEDSASVSPGVHELLENCQLAANLDWNSDSGGVHVKSGRTEQGVFRCIPPDSELAGFQEFGTAVFSPGDMKIPLLLPETMVADLQRGDFGDEDSTGEDSTGSAGPPRERAESLAAAARVLRDSLLIITRGLRDSLERAGLLRADSLRRTIRPHPRVNSRSMPQPQPSAPAPQQSPAPAPPLPPTAPARPR
jgi:hypothetical protein